MRAIVFLVALWFMPILFFGWRIYATWPSKQEQERQRQVSALYDCRFQRHRRRSYSKNQSDARPAVARGGSTFFFDPQRRASSRPRRA